MTGGPGVQSIIAHNATLNKLNVELRAEVSRLTCELELTKAAMRIAVGVLSTHGVNAKHHPQVLYDGIMAEAKESRLEELKREVRKGQ